MENTFFFDFTKGVGLQEELIGMSSLKPPTSLLSNSYCMIRIIIENYYHKKALS